jgi:hypothetical protein
MTIFTNLLWAWGIVFDKVCELAFGWDGKEAGFVSLVSQIR